MCKYTRVNSAPLFEQRALLQINQTENLKINQTDIRRLRSKWHCQSMAWWWLCRRSILDLNINPIRDCLVQSTSFFPHFNFLQSQSVCMITPDWIKLGVYFFFRWNIITCFSDAILACEHQLYTNVQLSGDAGWRKDDGRPNWITLFPIHSYCHLFCLFVGQHASHAWWRGFARAHTRDSVRESNLVPSASSIWP